MTRRTRLLTAAAAVAGAVLLVRGTALEPLTVSSPSREPALHVGSTVVVDKLTPRWSGVDVGDVVVFSDPQDGVDAVKRVVPVQGQTVALRDAVLHVDGVPVDEPASTSAASTARGSARSPSRRTACSSSGTRAGSPSTPASTGRCPSTPSRVAWSPSWSRCPDPGHRPPGPAAPATGPVQTLLLGEPDVVRLAGEMDVCVAAQLRSVLTALVTDHRTEIPADHSAVSFLDSTTLHAALAAPGRAGRRRVSGGRVGVRPLGLGSASIGAGRARPDDPRGGGRTPAQTPPGRPTDGDRSPPVAPDVGSWVVATFSSVTQQHVLQALAEYDARGAEQFLDVYGFAPSDDHPLVHEGRSYDSRAVLGVAHRFATGRIATPEEVESGFAGAVTILRRRGFAVSEPHVAPRVSAPATRTPRARTPRSAAATRTPTRAAGAAPERTPTICPTCSMALPATGVCDNCS